MGKGSLLKRADRSSFYRLCEWNGLCSSFLSFICRSYARKAEYPS